VAKEPSRKYLIAASGQNVSADRRDFQCDENQQKFNRAGQQAHAHCAKDNQRVVLALVVAILRQRVQREQQHHQHKPADKRVEEDCEGAGLDRVIKAGAHRQSKLPQAGPEGKHGSGCRNPAQRTP
jgi:hypothetical protein